MAFTYFVARFSATFGASGRYLRMADDREKKHGTEDTDTDTDGDAEGEGRKPRRGDDIAERLLALSAASLDIGARLPDDFQGKHIRSQLVRSATSAGANYEEARGAGSRADFVHKVTLSTKELRETAYWLKLVERCQYLRTKPLVREADELTSILIASARTARSRI